MKFASWFGHFGGSVFRRLECRQRTRRFIPRLELLEDRTVPSSFATAEFVVWMNSPGSLHRADSTIVDVTYRHSASLGAFEIKDFSFQVENPTTIGSSTEGAGSGKLRLGELILAMTRSELTALMPDGLPSPHRRP
jgi:hypothetical protein